jgi:DNA-binding response OmpR family regulator
MRILVVEDDELIAKTLETVLGEQHYVVDWAADGQIGWELAEVFSYDLIVLDVMLPKIDGIEFCQQLREKGDRTPILLLTAKSTTSEKTLGLDAGADDYVVKPFEIEELMARIRVLLRRKNSLIPSVLEWGNIRLDPHSCEVTYQDKQLSLTPKEYRLLELFLRNPQQVLTRSVILENLWSADETPGEDTITAHIKSLRQKLKQVGGSPDAIATVYGLGYRLKPQNSPMARASLSSLAIADKRTNKKQTEAALRVVWEKFKGQNSSRITILEQVITAYQQNAIEDETWQQARSVAHKLSGALGVFGMSEGSQIAQAIEQILKSDLPLSRTQIQHLSSLVSSLRLLLTESSSSPFLEKPLVRHNSASMLVVNDDRQIAERLVKLASASGIRIQLVATLSEAKSALTRSEIDVVLLVFSLADATEESLTSLVEIINTIPPMPTLLLMSCDDLILRLKASRLGNRVFFQKLSSPDRGLRAIAKILKQMQGNSSKVAIVDDDPQVLSVMRILLEPWGIKLVTLEEPSQFWEILEKFSPDLLVLDVEMPSFSGIELCQTVRNDPQWHNLPILFVSVRTDQNTIQQVLSAGGDDYINKSLMGPELVSRILNRLERVQLLKGLTRCEG